MLSPLEFSLQNSDVIIDGGLKMEGYFYIVNTRVVPLMSSFKKERGLKTQEPCFVYLHVFHKYHIKKCRT